MMPVAMLDDSLLLVPLAALGIILLVRALRRSLRSEDSSATSLRRGERQQRQEPTSEALAQWEVKLHEIGRDLLARLDSKIAILQCLIQTATAETSRLERALGEARQAGLSPESPGVSPLSIEPGGTGPGVSTVGPPPRPRRQSPGVQIMVHDLRQPTPNLD